MRKRHLQPSFWDARPRRCQARASDRLTSARAATPRLGRVRVVAAPLPQLAARALRVHDQRVDERGSRADDSSGPRRTMALGEHLLGQLQECSQLSLRTEACWAGQLGCLQMIKEVAGGAWCSVRVCFSTLLLSASSPRRSGSAGLFTMSAANASRTPVLQYRGMGRRQPPPEPRAPPRSSPCPSRVSLPRR